MLIYYGELDAGHVRECTECAEELARMARVLDQVNAIEVPEPDQEYEAQVWNRLSWRLRGEKRKSKSAVRWLAAAAMIMLAFITGLLVNRREAQPQIAVKTPQSVTPAAGQDTPGGAAEPVKASTQQQRDRILLVVVGDHFDESERVLVELTNLTPDGETDITTEQKRAEELLASNRLYRRTARDRGEENVATLLDELEPVLMQIAHAPSQMSENDLRRIQKRVEAKGLVFKLRVVRAGVRNQTNIPQLPTI